MKRLILPTLLLSAALLTGCSGSHEALPVYDLERANYSDTANGLNASSQDTVRLAEKEGLFALSPAKENSQHFQNKVSGYTLTVPGDFSVLDMGDARYRSTLGNDTTRLDIYTQTLVLEETNADTYLNYSNIFLENTEEFHKTFDQRTTIDGADVRLLTWTRRPLARLEDDRPYYGVVDMVKGDRVVSLALSQTTPIDTATLESYAKSLKWEEPSAQAKDYPRFAIIRDNLNEETKAFYKETFSDESPFTWGFFEPTLKGNTGGKLPALEEKLDHDFKILLYYSGIREDFQPGYIYDTLSTIRNEGAVCELTLQTALYDPKVGANAVYDILNGKYDDFLHAYAQEVADFGHPVLFRPFNEMNGDWCNYSALWAGRDANTYVALYRYVYDIFESHGANANTLWIWNPNESSFPPFAWNYGDNYYPGDEFVDIVGITGYNTGDYYEGETWRSFDDIYAPIYAEMASQYQQPLMITEFACSNIGGDKAAWMKDMLKSMPDYPRIKAAVWWNSADKDTDGTIARSYYIDDNDKAFRAFKDHLAEDH